VDVKRGHKKEMAETQTKRKGTKETKNYRKEQREEQFRK
jgi:hypothetical protein